MSFLEIITKNLFNNKLRASLSIIGISLCLTIIILLASLNGGFFTTMQETSDTGFFIINDSMKDYGENVDLDLSITDALNSTPGVVSYAPILKTRYNTKETQITLLGIDNEYLSALGVNLKKWTSYGQNETIIITEERAEREHLELGNTITIDGTVFTIGGIATIDNAEFQDPIITNLNKAQNITGTEPNFVSMVFVKVNPNYGLDTIQSGLQSKMPKGVKVFTDTTKAESIKEIEKITNSIINIVSLTIILIMGLIAFSMALLSVNEGKKSFGLLKAARWTKKEIFGLVIGEVLLLMIISFIIASILSILISMLLYGLNLLGPINPTLSIPTLIWCFLISLIIGVVAGYYPAYKASKIKPIYHSDNPYRD